MICARLSGDNLFAFAKFSAASGMFASLAIALTVPGLIPPISLATAVAFGLDEADPALLQPCFERMEALLSEPPMRQAFGRLGGWTLIAWIGFVAAR